MEEITSQFVWTDLVAWLLIAVLAVLAFKFLMTAGKGLVYAICMLVIFCILYRFFPEFVAPVLELISASKETVGQ
jgi:Kef-type K+ transport system membrane component KefB